MGKSSALLIVVLALPGCADLSNVRIAERQFVANRNISLLRAELARSNARIGHLENISRLRNERLNAIEDLVRDNRRLLDDMRKSNGWHAPIPGRSLPATHNTKPSPKRPTKKRGSKR